MIPSAGCPEPRRKGGDRISEGPFEGFPAVAPRAEERCRTPSFATTPAAVWGPTGWTSKPRSPGRGRGLPPTSTAGRRRRSVFSALDRALRGTDHLIAVALKANALPALLAPLRDRGAGVEAVSAAELLLADGLGFPGDRIVMSGVGKTETDLDTALDLGVRFVSVESGAELELLDARAARRGRRARVALRLNPAIAADTHPKIATGAAGVKFGIAEAELLALAERRRQWPAVEIVGVHAHIGSQILELDALGASAARLGAVFARLRRAGVPVRMLDLGGGLGIPQREGDAEVTLDSYAEAVLGALAETPAVREAELVFEPGRRSSDPAARWWSGCSTPSAPAAASSAWWTAA